METITPVEAKRADPFQTLPIELSLCILQHMDSRSMLLSNFVSRTWRDLSNDDALWKELCEQDLRQRDGHDMEALLEARDRMPTTWKELYLMHAFQFKETRILGDEHRKLLATEWLGRDVSWRLQFRATRDGFDPAAFHQLCDNRGATVTVCLSTKGFVFGGYNPKSWSAGSKDPELRNSPDAFIFSMVNPPGKPPCRMFPTKDPRSACNSNSSYGPLWGNGYDLGVFGFPNGRGRSAWCRLGATYTAPYAMSEIGNQHHFIGGNPRDFDLAEVEVYVVRRDLGRRRRKALQRQEKQAEKEKALKNSGWACSACTYINAQTKVQCGICATPKGKSKLFISSGNGSVRVRNQRTLSSNNIMSTGVGPPGPNSNARSSPLVSRRMQACTNGTSPLSPSTSRRSHSKNNSAAGSSTPTGSRRANGPSTPNSIRRNGSGNGASSLGVPKGSSDAIRRTMTMAAECEESPAAMIRRMSREREALRDRELAAVAEMGEDKRAGGRRDRDGMREWPRQSSSRRKVKGKGKEKDEDREEKGKEKEVRGSGEVSTTLGRMTLLQKVSSPSWEDLYTAVAPSSSSSSSSSSSFSSSPTSMSYFAKLKDHQRNDDEDLRRPKQVSSLRRKGKVDLMEEWKRFNRSTSDVSPTSTRMSKSPRSHLVQKGGAEQQRRTTKLHKSEELDTVPKARGRESQRTTKEREREKERARREKEKEQEKGKRRGSSRREKRAPMTVPATSEIATTPPAEEEKKVGTLRKLISVKPSIQFKKNEVSITFRRRSKSGEKEKGSDIIRAPSSPTIGQQRSDSWLRANRQ